jgi:ATP/maltotriose-dependent transcriptional regulator MalT
MAGAAERDVIVGRERELEAIERLLVRAGEGARAVLLEGEAGIGKTTVWEAALAAAAAEGHRVLSCRPVEAEAKLVFAALGDLVEPVADDGLAALPGPQRAALEIALLRAPRTGGPPDRRAVGMATRSLLRTCAEDGCVVVAIDDLQWLDRGSATVLSFALRRLQDSPVLVLATARLERGRFDDPLQLDRALPGRVERLRVEPLSLSGVYHVLRTHAGRVFPRPTLRRIVEASGGNPLFALELARALEDVGARPGPGEALPVPRTLAALLHDRIERLPDAEREALLAAAALSSPEPSLIAAALGEGATAALEAAEREGLIAPHGDRLRFSHPLLASAVYSSASSARRRDLHRRLAGVVADPEERARHEALGTSGPDERVAASLDDAARDADVRGAPEVAVELAELARRLTPPDDTTAQSRRTLALADYVFRAGDAEEARRLLDGSAYVAGPLRARALELAARLQHVSGTSQAAVARCEEALAEAGDDVELRARIHATAALVSWDDFNRARRHARAALDLLENLDEPDPGVLSQALMAYVEAEFFTGRGLPMEAVERGLELERLAPAPCVSDRMSAALGVWLKYQGDFDGARRWLEAAHRAAIEEGDDSSLPYVVGHFPQLELWTGDWARAEETALEHLELSEQTAQPDQRRQAIYNLALVHAHKGRVEEAEAEARELLRDAEAEGERWGASNALAVLGLIALSLERPAEAAEHLERNVELREGIGSQEPLRAWGHCAEALVEIGQLDRAAEVLAVLESRARAVDRVPLLAVAACGRALLAAARQDLDEAAAALEEAIAHHERVTVPFDLARTLVVAGQVRRRRGERRAARDALEQARTIFDELGAPLWSARAEAELRRVPIRRGAGDDLTPTEERVAELVASGQTNREVATALFMSPKTVEANLSRIYRKLGIRSRAELGATMAERRVAPPKP